MKKPALYILLVVLASCSSFPKNFTYAVENGDTGLASRINIEGYYLSQHGCDSAFFSMYMFYPNGLFTIATTSEVSEELINCFTLGGKSTVCQYPLWGIYKLDGDTIKTQTIRPEGGGCVIFRDYLILPTKEITNISDYLEPQYTAMAYMQNYPSFTHNECLVPATFHPTQQKRSAEDCQFAHKSHGQ